MESAVFFGNISKCAAQHNCKVFFFFFETSITVKLVSRAHTVCRWQPQLGIVYHTPQGRSSIVDSAKLLTAKIRLSC